MGRPGLDGLAARAQRARRADGDLRGPPRLVAPRRRRSPAPLPRSGAAAGRLRAGRRLHARRAAAGDGAPVLRILGLPEHRLLRADQPLRDAAGPDVPDRPAAPARRRRAPRLGALALPGRPARAELVRRLAPLRARRPARGLSPRLGQLYLQLWATRGPLLPAQQRPVLARPLPRRRPAGRRGRLDALPQLLAERRRVGAEPVWRAREPRGGRLPAPAQRDDLRQLPRRADDRRGVDRLADGLAPDR